MRTTLSLAFSLLLTLVAGCESLPSGFPGSGQTKTFEVPIARVKPAFVSTHAQMGMPISAIETRGKNEVLKAKRGDKSVELERLSATSTRVRVIGNDDAAGQIMRETERRLGSS